MHRLAVAVLPILSSFATPIRFFAFLENRIYHYLVVLIFTTRLRYTESYSVLGSDQHSALKEQY